MPDIQFRCLVFMEGFLPQDEYEMPVKGFRTDVLAEFSDGSRYRLAFYDPTRLAQDLECEVLEGKVHLTEPGLIILREVTRENMERAVIELHGDGYFETLRPIDC